MDESSAERTFKLALLSRQQDKAIKIKTFYVNSNLSANFEGLKKLLNTNI